MSKPVYHVVFHDGWWRIKFEGLHIGEFDSAETATDAALKVARSRLGPSPDVAVKNRSDGELIIGDPE
jgi:hypothetical protein